MSVDAVHRVNLSFQISVQLCFNPDSYNRGDDVTPRFFLKPIKVLYVDKVGFTAESRKTGYTKHGNRFWKYKAPEGLTDETIEEVWEMIKTNYPYGYKENDTPSYLKYVLDVKQSETFQSHYARYWKNNLALKKCPVLQADGTYDQGHPYDYIEFTINEIVTVKFPKGTVPEKTTLVSKWSEYSEGSYYSPPLAYSCHEEEINVYVRKYDDELAFYIGNFIHYPITVFSAGGSYNFHLVSGLNPEGYGGTEYFWPSGGSYANWSGYRFSFSTGTDGTWEEHDEYTDNVQRFVSPEVHSPWYLTVSGKDSTHPYYGFGSSSGYVVSGESNQSLDISLTRGHTYEFSQTGSSNSGHRLYISTDSGGANTLVYSEGVTHCCESGTSEGQTLFKVPYDSPDALYYQCQHHEFMGGKLNISDPVAAEGDKPGQTVRITFNQGKDDIMAYYCAEGEGNSAGTSGMGGFMFLKKECDGEPVDF